MAPAHILRLPLQGNPAGHVLVRVAPHHSPSSNGLQPLDLELTATEGEQAYVRIRKSALELRSCSCHPSSLFFAAGLVDPASCLVPCGPPVRPKTSEPPPCCNAAHVSLFGAPVRVNLIDPAVSSFSHPGHPSPPSQAAHPSILLSDVVTDIVWPANFGYVPVFLQCNTPRPRGTETGIAPCRMPNGSNV